MERGCTGRCIQRSRNTAFTVVGSSTSHCALYQHFPTRNSRISIRNVTRKTFAICSPYAYTLQPGTTERSFRFLTPAHVDGANEPCPSLRRRSNRRRRSGLFTRATHAEHTCSTTAPRRHSRPTCVVVQCGLHKPNTHVHRSRRTYVSPQRNATFDVRLSPVLTFSVSRAAITLANYSFGGRTELTLSPPSVQPCEFSGTYFDVGRNVHQSMHFD